MDLLKYSISPRSKRLLHQLLSENEGLERIISIPDYDLFIKTSHRFIAFLIKKRPHLQNYIQNQQSAARFKELVWSDYALLRLYNYLQYQGKFFTDFNVKKKKSISDPFRMIWLAYHQGIGGAKSEFFYDAIHLFRQLRTKKVKRKPSRSMVEDWMDAFPSGTDAWVQEIIARNKDRIIKTFIELYEKGFYGEDQKYVLPENFTYDEKYKLVNQWWDNYKFHLHFAIRDYKTLNTYLGESLSPNKLEVFRLATKKGLPFFVNFYYLSLLNINKSSKIVGLDISIRDYIFYNRGLIGEFGKIKAWEKEDLVEPGKPNAAGWILPEGGNIHRRYPEVAIYVPDSMGRSCGGLCVSCQRMYDFQNGHLNFNLDKLKPKQSFQEKLQQQLSYFETEADLCDLLITGGDSFMSSNATLKKILDAVLEMAKRKNKAIATDASKAHFSPMERVRLGTRLPVYLPMRVDAELVQILREFKTEGQKLGIRQFIIQTHFISPLEITQDAEKAVAQLLSAGWLVTNQSVYTTSASRRGHMSKLRQSLNKIGIIPYYNFSVKGFLENKYNFATNARICQEVYEEKPFGFIPDEELNRIAASGDIKAALNQYLKEHDQLFVASDRSVMNLPGVGKSLSFSVIGITFDGRRILQFKYDKERNHSPMIKMQEDVIIVESKSIKEYIEQMEYKGCNKEDYESIYGYSLSITEKRKALFQYETSS